MKIAISINKLMIFCVVCALAIVLSTISGKSIASYTLVFAAIALVPQVFEKGQKSIDIFDPHLTLSVLLYLYSVSTLAYVTSFEETYYKESVTLGEIEIYQLCCVLGIMALSVGKVIALNGVSQSRNISGPKEFFHRRAGRVVVCLGIIFFVTFIYFVKDKFMPWAATSYSDMALTVRVLSLEDKAAGIKEIITETIPLFFIIGGCVVLNLSKSKSFHILKIAGFFLLFAYILTMFLSGWRSQMMSALVLIAIYYHYVCSRLPVRSVLIGSVLVYVVINFLSIMRGSSSPIEMVKLLAEAFQERGLELLAVSQSGELATSTNLIRLISGINNNETDFGYGTVALDQIFALVPRVFVADRPMIASEKFVKIFYPGVYESGGGYGFFILQDGYWDFGLIGVVGYMLLFSILTQKIYYFYLRRLGHPFWTLFYGLIFYNLIFSSIRSGIFASIKSTLIVALPVLLIYKFSTLVSAKFRVKRTNHEDMDTSDR